MKKQPTNHMGNTIEQSNTGLQLPVDIATLLHVLGTLGLTTEECALVFGLPESTFRGILGRNPGLQTIFESAKQEPNRRVEASLYRRALGYPTRETIKVAGKPAKVVLKDVAPDVVACIFWLKNRDPKRWRDALDVGFTVRDRFDRAHQALRSGALQLSDKERDDEGDGSNPS